MSRIICALLTFFVATPAIGQGGGQGGGGSRTVSFATGVMALTNSTKQGGQGAEGSTILTQTDLTYHGAWWAAGAYVQFDKQGDSETDIAAGPRLELTLNPFYLEFGYAAMMNRSFTDRAIEEQTGKGYTLGVGARFSLGASAFMQFSYKYRTQIVDEQDGAAMSEKVTQTDGYPLGGIGFGF